MNLKVRPMGFEAGGIGIVMLNKSDAGEMGIGVLERAVLRKNGRTLIAIVDVAEKFVEKGYVVTNSEVTRFFKFRQGDMVEVVPAEAPESVRYVRQRINGIRLDRMKMKEIVKDVVERHLSDIELSAFVMSLHDHPLSMDEAEGLSMAMVETGKRLKIKGKKICDKHSVGGIPGDKTSMIAVPIIAAAGLTIPKTSSRAITSPAGTADRMEVIAPVDLGIEEIYKVVKKTNGCLVWGGSLDLAPADDVFIRIEHPLGVDPLMLPSIMSKKKAVGAKYVVIDIPTGRGAKIKTIGSAYSLASEFRDLGRRMGMNIACAITFGEQPLGNGIGPALEAREALQTLEGRGPADVVEKVVSVVGALFELTGKSRNIDAGKKLALEILGSGKALKKMKEIIGAQGGDPKIRSSDIALAKRTARIFSKKSGKVLWMKNAEIAMIAKELGAPQDKKAGIMLNKKIGDSVKKGELLMTLYAENQRRLGNAAKMAETMEPTIVDESIERRMLMGVAPDKMIHRKAFMLER